jgi:hypothetical protein
VGDELDDEIDDNEKTTEEIEHNDSVVRMVDAVESTVFEAGEIASITKIVHIESEHDEKHNGGAEESKGDQIVVDSVRIRDQAEDDQHGSNNGSGQPKASVLTGPSGLL